MRGEREALKRRGDDGVEGTLGSFGPVLGGELVWGGQFAVPEQVGDFLEAAGTGEFLDWVAAVGQRVGVRVDHGDGGGVGDHAGQSLADPGFCTRHGSAPSLAFGAAAGR